MEDKLPIESWAPSSTTTTHLSQRRTQSPSARTQSQTNSQRRTQSPSARTQSQTNSQRTQSHLSKGRRAQPRTQSLRLSVIQLQVCFENFSCWSSSPTSPSGTALATTLVFDNFATSALWGSKSESHTEFYLSRLFLTTLSR